jgi:transcriptional regulator with XRE-family HTH domain
MYGMKLKMVREMRGMTQEGVAQRLGIAQNTYSKYETNQIKISAEVLQKLAEVFEVSPMDLMSPQPAVINFEQNHGNVIGHVENLITSQKELYEQMLASKDAEIERLVKLLDSIMAKK